MALSQRLGRYGDNTPHIDNMSLAITAGKGLVIMIGSWGLLAFWLAYGQERKIAVSWMLSLRLWHHQHEMAASVCWASLASVKKFYVNGLNLYITLPAKCKVSGLLGELTFRWLIIYCLNYHYYIGVLEFHHQPTSEDTGTICSDPLSNGLFNFRAHVTRCNWEAHQASHDLTASFPWSNLTFNTGIYHSGADPKVWDRIIYVHAYEYFEAQKRPLMHEEMFDGHSQIN